MLLLASLCLLAYTTTGFDIPVFHVKGTHYEVGEQVGKHFASRIHSYIQESEEVTKVLIPFAATSQGKSVVERFLMLNQRAYPNYFKEVQGLAAGSGVPLSTLILLQFADELEAGWISSNFPKSNCADVHVHSNNVLIGHNEDSEPAIKKYSYIVEYEFTDSREHFVAYTYPGHLPGDAWGFSRKANLTFSMNWVGPLPVTVGLARGFINRAIFGASSKEDAIKRATPDNRAFGWTLNLGDISAARSYSFEISPAVFSTFEVSQNYSHFNMYKALNIHQIFDESTEHRQARCNEFLIPRNEDDVRAILGDTKDKEFPIFRVASSTDPLDTAVSVVFDLINLVASVWDNNPKLNPAGLKLPLN